MNILYQSRHGVQRVHMPQLLGHELGAWYDGQVRDVPDDLEIRYKPRGAGQRVRTMKAVDALLLAGPDFRDAATGLNPDFTCCECGRETLSTHYIDGNGNRHELLHNGKPVCLRDYLLLRPTDHPAWKHMRLLEHSSDLDEADEMLAERAAAAAASDAPPVVAPPPPPPAPVAAAPSFGPIDTASPSED